MSCRTRGRRGLAHVFVAQDAPGELVSTEGNDNVGVGHLVGTTAALVSEQSGTRDEEW